MIARPLTDDYRSWDTPGRDGTHERTRCIVCDGLGSIEFPAIHSLLSAMQVCCPAPLIEGFTQCKGKGYIQKERNK